MPKKEHMGLTTWGESPQRKNRQDRCQYCKRLSERCRIGRYGTFGQLRTGYGRAYGKKRHIPMTMEDWAKRIDIILEAGGDEILTDAGKVTAEFAKEFAESEFEKYRIIQDRLFSSDLTDSIMATTYCHLILTLIKNNDYAK